MENTLDDSQSGMEVLGFVRRANMRCTEAVLRNKDTAAADMCDVVDNEAVVEPEVAVEPEAVVELLRPEWSEGKEAEVSHGIAALPYPQVFLVPQVVSQCDAFPLEEVE